MRRVAMLVVAAMLAVGSGGTADAADKSQDPVELFNAAAQLAENGLFRDAIRIWEEIAFELPMKYQSTVQLNMALAYQQLELLPDAWHHADLARQVAPEGDTSARELLEELTRELIGTHTKVLIFVKPEDAQIYLGEKAEGVSFRSPLYWWFEPGEKLRPVHVVRDGHKPRTEFFKVKRGASPYQTVKVELEKMAEPEPKGVAKGGESKKGGGRSRILEWSLIGGGAALVATGGLMGGLASARNDELVEQYPDGTAGHLQAWENREDYNQAYDSEVLPKLIGSYALYGVGAAAAVTGAVLLIVRRDAAPAAGRVEVAPLWLEQGSGFCASFIW